MANHDGWHIIHRFPGQHTWQELNDLIRFDSGVTEDYFDSEDDYNKAVRDGWIEFDGTDTIIWCDGLH